MVRKFRKTHKFLCWRRKRKSTKEEEITDLLVRKAERKAIDLPAPRLGDFVFPQILIINRTPRSLRYTYSPTLAYLPLKI